VVACVTAVQLTLIVLAVVGAAHAAAAPVGPDGTVCEWASPELAVRNVTVQFVA
jgi:hypothetical protein